MFLEKLELFKKQEFLFINLIAIVLGMLMRLSFMPISAWWLVWPIMLVLWRLIFTSENFYQATSILTSWWLGLFSITLWPWLSYSTIHYAYFSVFIAAPLILVFLVLLALFGGWCGGLMWLSWHSNLKWWLKLLLVIAIWLLMEGLLTYVAECGWFNLAYSQLGGPLASLVPQIGSLGLELVLLGHLALSYEWIFGFLDEDGATLSNVKPSAKFQLKWVYLGFTTFSLALAILGYVQATKYVAAAERLKPLNIQVVQQATRPDQKWQKDWETMYLASSGLESWLHDEQLCSQASLAKCLQPAPKLKNINHDPVLLVWPEGALAEIVKPSDDFWQQLSLELERRNLGLVTGCLLASSISGEINNGLLGLGLASGTYRKQRLLPFGEFVPGLHLLSERWQRYLAKLIPFNDLAPGSAKQRLIEFNLPDRTLKIGAVICSEVSYPYLISRQLPEAQLLVVVADDSWFSLKGSFGWMHLATARMRALEARRYVVFANNSGPSAVIDPAGRMSAKTKPGVSEVLDAKVYLLP